MAKSIKETLLGTLVHGEKVLQEIEENRAKSPNKILPYNQADKVINKLHKENLKVEIVSITDTKKNAKIIKIKATDGYLSPFEAGQYINIFTVIDGVRTSRPYSISSSPLEREYYEITVARTQNGFVSDFLLDKAKVGDVFEANGPAGVFRFNPVFHSQKSLFLAGGSGITPFLSMAREIFSKKSDREVVLLYGTRNSEVALYHDEFQKMAKENKNFTYHLVVSEEEKGWKGETGFIDKNLIKKLVPDFMERTSYICGPQIMNDFCKKELEELGVPEKKIRREMFGASAAIIQEAGWPQNLTGEEVFNVKVGDQTLEAKSSESLLTSLERSGIRVNVCCRSGECSLCRVQLVTGEVFLSKGMMLRKADEKYGYVHSCKTYPISDIEILL